MIDLVAKRFQKKQTVHPMAAGMVGAIAGAAVGTVATIALSDKKKREKIVETVAHVKDQAFSAFDSFKQNVSSPENKIERGAKMHQNEKNKINYS